MWEEQWFTPRYDDLAIYSSLLHHTQLGINPASTVTLELLMLGKPVINLGFDPPGSRLPPHLRWHRHLEFSHFQPIVKSGVTKVAYSISDLRKMVREYLENPAAGLDERNRFISGVFGQRLDGQSGIRAGKQMLELAGVLNKEP